MAARYKGYRYPIEVIGHAVWLYHRFTLSLRDVEELMLARGVVVSYETIRSWCAKFGPDYAAQLRRRRPRPGDKWHLDEVFVKINGTTHYLWRAVDQHGGATNAPSASTSRYGWNRSPVASRAPRPRTTSTAKSRGCSRSPITS
ncbi:MAG: DDE-type integrase/transposase/recombinase, partial [Pseudolabrys sp.]